MGIETRNGREYFYRKRREGNRVISEYVGSSFLGLQFYVFEKAERDEANKKRIVETAKREQLTAIDRSLNDFEKSIRTIIKAYLVGKGTSVPHK